MTQCRKISKMDNFYTIRFKRRTAKRFKAFSKKVASSYSETMEHIIDFFEWHGFLPSERFEKSVGQELIRNRKRTEAAIAIIKDIEKQQTLPAKAMLDTLFREISQVENGEAEELEEDFDFGAPEPFSRDTELEHYRNRYEEMQQLLSGYKNQVQELLEQLIHVKGTFGKGHYRLDMDMEEFENLKKRLNNVHHHHRPEN